MNEKEQKKYTELMAMSRDMWPAKLTKYAEEVKKAQGGQDLQIQQIEEVIMFYVTSGAAFSA